LGRGTGKSKKVAEMEAAKSAWGKLRAKEALNNYPLAGEGQIKG
jgi:dsRNA-specific ribonuclease